MRSKADAGNRGAGAGPETGAGAKGKSKEGAQQEGAGVGAAGFWQLIGQWPPNRVGLSVRVR